MSALITLEEAVASVQDGMTVGIGGWGSRRKPMALVAALARSGAKDLTLVSYGGPDVGVLSALGRVKRLVFGFVSLDSIPLEPHFRKERQAGRLADVVELDEGMFLQGLRAAAWRLPFLPTRAGLGSDVLRVNPDLKLVRDPYGGGDLVAMPALKLDVAFVHVNRADEHGNGQVLGPDPYFDDLFCLAADRAYMSCEQLGIDHSEHPSTLIINPTMVHGVIEAPAGAGFTECPPDYDRDEAAQRAYAKTAKDPESWARWCRDELGIDLEVA